jgi:hypothetical protein
MKFNPIKTLTKYISESDCNNAEDVFINKIIKELQKTPSNYLVRFKNY